MKTSRRLNKLSRSSRKKSMKGGRFIHRTGLKDRAGIFEMAGAEIKCDHCGQNLFKERRIQLKQRWKSFWGFGLFNQRARVMRCCNCSCLMWFNVKPELKEEKDVGHCFSTGL